MPTAFLFTTRPGAGRVIKELHFGFHFALAIRHGAFIFFAAHSAAVRSVAAVGRAGGKYLARRNSPFGVAGHGGSAARHGAGAGRASARRRLGGRSLGRGYAEGAQASG